VQRIYRLREPLDTVSLLAAFRYVVASNPALRTRLVETPDGWRQWFPELEAEISGIVVEGRTRETRAAYAQHIFAKDSAQPLDLRSDPPFLARIIRVDGEHYFSLCLDHIAADDLATDIFERELDDAYLREKEGKSHPPSSASQYFFHYLARETAQDAKEASNLEYWRNHLIGHSLDLSKTEERKWVAGETHHWQISGGEFERLKGACHSHRSSVFSAVLGAYVRLLSELGRTEELVVNVPVSNRTQAVDHGLIANLSMLLHLRFNVAGTAPDPQFLIAVRNQILDGMAHRYYSYSALSEIMSQNAAARGGHVHWLAGCSYIIERELKRTTSPLFEERLDNLPGAKIDIPSGGFALTCRENLFRLHFAADWDLSCWPSHSHQMETRFLEILAAVVGTTSLDSRQAGLQ
jgi:hypothetical protein